MSGDVDPGAFDLALQAGGVVGVRRRDGLVNLGINNTVARMAVGEAARLGAALNIAAAEPATMSAAMLTRSVAAIPGPDGWWSSSGHDRYQELAAQLVFKGFTPDEALQVLEAAYAAAAGEFGS